MIQPTKGSTWVSDLKQVLGGHPLLWEGTSNQMEGVSEPAEEAIHTAAPPAAMMAGMAAAREVQLAVTTGREAAAAQTGTMSALFEALERAMRGRGTIILKAVAISDLALLGTGGERKMTGEGEEMMRGERGRMTGITAQQLAGRPEIETGRTMAEAADMTLTLTGWAAAPGSVMKHPGAQAMRIESARTVVVKAGAGAVGAGAEAETATVAGQGPERMMLLGITWATPDNEAEAGVETGVVAETERGRADIAATQLTPGAVRAGRRPPPPP